MSQRERKTSVSVETAIATTNKHVGLKFGNLHKCSFRIKRWTHAWFVLEWRDLTYYDDDQYDAPKVIPLTHQCSVLEADINETKRPFSFKLAVKRRTYVLATDSRSSMEEWIYALRSVSGLYLPPPTTVSTASTSSEQATLMLQSVENILSLCSKFVTQAANAQIPGVCDQAKLTILTTSSIKCAASSRVVAYRPNIQSALQQLISSLTEISEHSRRYGEFLQIVRATSKKNELDDMVSTSEALASISQEMLERCTEPEPPTEQETILLASKNATTASSNVLAMSREKDIHRLVEASKTLVNMVNVLYETTKSLRDKTGHEHPKTVAFKTIQMSRDVIAASKQFHLSSTKEDEAEASLAVARLQEQISAVVVAFQNVGQQEILEQQISEAVATIQNAASDIHVVAYRRSTNFSEGEVEVQPKSPGGSTLQVNSPNALKVMEAARTLVVAVENMSKGPGEPTSQASATNALRVIEAAKTLAEAINTLPNAIKLCSKTTLFNVAKTIGTATNSMVQVSAQFLSAFPSTDPNFQSHVNSSIKSIQNSGLQLLAISKVVIQEEFKNQSDLLLLSGVARAHALCTAHILSIFKVHITPKAQKIDDRISVSSGSTSSDSYEMSDGFTSVSLSDSSSSVVSNPRDSTSSGAYSPSISHRSFFTHESMRELPSRGSKSARLLQNLLDEYSQDDEEGNIWNEPPDSEDNIIMGIADDGEPYIRAATLNKLVIKLTNENDHDIKFQKQFIITYRSFTTPAKLFTKLMQRYNVVIPKLPAAITHAEYRKRSVLPIQLRVINVLKMWLETAFYDMNDELVKKLRHFTEHVLVGDGHASLAAQIGSIIDKQVNARNEIDHPHFEPPMQVEPTASMGLEEFSEETIAQNLTIVDFEMYTTIKPVELLNQAWNKEPFKHRAPNVLAMIARFNSISMWAASIILWKQTIKERVALWVKLVNITEFLLKLNNFNTTLAIISGLNSAATFRLKYTRAELPKKTQSQFEIAMQLMNSEGSYKAYREALHNANPPCVPYLGMYLTDVTFIEDGNKDFIRNLINFRKRQLVSAVVSEIQLYQQFPYDLPSDEKLLSFFRNLPSSTEEQLYQISLLREPRNAERSDIL